MSDQRTLFDLPEGLARKRDGQGSVLDHEDHVWKAMVRQVVADLARTHRPFNSDDLHEHCVKLGVGEPFNWNSWGAMLSAMGAAGVIRKTGAKHRSARPEAHGREINIWIGR